MLHLHRFWTGTLPRGAWLREWLRDSLPYDTTTFIDFLGGLRRFRRDTITTLAIAQQVDLPIVAATDAPGTYPWRDNALGFTLHRLLLLYVERGLTPVAALQAATLNPAKALHATDSLGTVTAGKLADLVLLDADPLADITNTTAIRAVVANGRYFDRAALDRILADVQAAAQREPSKFASR